SAITPLRVWTSKSKVSALPQMGASIRQAPERGSAFKNRARWMAKQRLFRQDPRHQQEMGPCVFTALAAARAQGQDPHMLNFILRKLALLVPTIIGISICAFAFVRVLPGDPILAMAGQHGVTPERYEILREQFGYNLPIWQQYFNYLGSVLQGDFGISLATKRPVINEFMALFPATVELALTALIFAVAVGIPADIFAAIKRGSWIDQLSMSVALAGYSMPI